MLWFIFLQAQTVHQRKKRIDNHSHSVQSVKSFTKWYVGKKIEFLYKMSSAIINNNSIKQFINIYDSSLCSLINSLWETSLFKWFVKGEVILKSIIFSQTYINSQAGSCIVCGKYKNIAGNAQVNETLIKFLVYSSHRAGQGRDGRDRKHVESKRWSNIVPTKEKCETCF